MGEPKEVEVRCELVMQSGSEGEQQQAESEREGKKSTEPEREDAEQLLAKVEDQNGSQVQIKEETEQHLKDLQQRGKEAREDEMGSLSHAKMDAETQTVEVEEQENPKLREIEERNAALLRYIDRDFIIFVSVGDVDE
ncbi:hypothetical protein AMELA_G00164150 [Ameiurus melas]|uniref:Uncharacterized protein n=1 Tax=Ameiurus melas TaxID=219545 RepID=A0A7J6AJL1_AMEME|nr:hypothetical protein AMELA_G00164150 [Ameiurus melas]